MTTRIGLVHATLAAVEPMVAAFRTHAPDTAVMHFLDEGLLPLANKEGLTTYSLTQIAHLVSRAVASGADGVLLTCSAYSPAVPGLQASYSVPIVSVDEAMLRQAVAIGERIGVVATVSAAAPTTVRLLRAYAEEAGKRIDTRERIVPEAFEALQAGDGARHDMLVREQVEALLPDSDVVVLAQISMARALTGKAAFAKPVLASPEASIRAMLGRLSLLSR